MDNDGRLGIPSTDSIHIAIIIYFLAIRFRISTPRSSVLSSAAKLTLSTYWRSSCSFRVRIALGYKKLAYESKHVNIVSGEQKTPEYLALNPIGHVPTRNSTSGLEIINFRADLLNTTNTLDEASLHLLAGLIFHELLQTVVNFGLAHRGLHIGFLGGRPVGGVHR